MSGGGRRSVALYYFDIIDNDVLARDEFGVELGSIEEARDQAQALLPDIAVRDLPNGELHKITCEVRDEADKVVYRGELTFRGTWF